MKTNNQEIELTNQINNLIELNQEAVLAHLEETLVEYRKMFFQELLDPCFLCFTLNFEIIEKEDLENNTKTILSFEKTTPYIYYNRKLNNYELNFCFMKEFIYYLMMLYVLPSTIKIEKLFMNKVNLHSINSDKPKNRTEEIVNKIMEEVAINFLIPEEIFYKYYNETKDIKKCSEYFGVEEKIIENFLLKNRNNIKTLKKSRR